VEENNAIEYYFSPYASNKFLFSFCSRSRPILHHNLAEAFVLIAVHVLTFFLLMNSLIETLTAAAEPEE
jgi:hypothetical protein